MTDSFACGPVSIRLSAATPAWRRRAAGVLALYTPWAETPLALDVHIHASAHDADMTTGHFLRTIGVHVDQTETGLYATCRSGAYGRLNASLQRWELFMPERFAAGDAPTAVDDNLEDLLELALTTAWREAGWIPLHAGAVVQGIRCALVTAPSRGGKTTMTVAMLHRGWQTLGDDKQLVRLNAGRCAELYALQSVFNIDPQTRRWFPEVGDLSTLPLDSAWTPKRRLPVEQIWPERMLAHAQPTHLIQVQRCPERRPASANPLSAHELLSALLHQTVVPAERAAAGQVIAVMAALARSLRGVRIELGHDAYADPHTLDRIEQLLA